ncbi:MAG: DNA translocase FtsK [Chloroflexota bacterium]|nr:DNA translocase FtsK [Chloroflexota bacterium]
MAATEKQAGTRRGAARTEAPKQANTRQAAPKRTTQVKPASKQPATTSGRKGKQAVTRPKPARASRQHIGLPPLLRAPQFWSRAVGLLLLLGAVYLGVSVAESGVGRSAPLRALIESLGVGTAPLVALGAALTLFLLFSPERLFQPGTLRKAGGVVLVLVACVALLGAVGAGGAVGNAAWNATAGPLGLGALPIFLGAVVVGLLLAGVPPRVMRSAVAGVLRSVLGLLSSVLYGLVGAIVWVAQGRSRGQQEEEQPFLLEREWRPVVERDPPAPPPVEDAPVEVTQPALPVIQKVIDEPVRRPAPRQDGWLLPPITLLEVSPDVEVSEADAHQQAKVIEDTLASFGVQARVREINPGPTVTQFALEPGMGTKVARITSLQNDLALALAAPSIRMEAPVPGQSRLGLEIPSGQPTTVRLRDVMDSGAFHNSKGKLKLALGRDVTGRAVVGDLVRMPHLLIAGATGAGKSVCLNSIIAGFLFQHTPDELRFLMVDPKMVELKTFDGVPHLVWPVVTEVEKVVGILKYAVGEMERRYKEFSELGIRNLDGYNRKREAEGEPKLTRLVVIIDELADLMMAAPEEVEASICRLAQMARAVGIHLILATQRPSVDVLTGLIKANFPSRIAFAVSSQIDSRVILDMPGAERLLGRGDMLFLGPDSAKPMRVQGTFVSDEEIEAVVAYWKDLQPAEYDPEVGKLLEAESRKSENPHEDPLYAQALELAQTHGRLSTSLLQRKLRIGYNRAARLMDALKDSGDLDTELDD